MATLRSAPLTSLCSAAIISSKLLNFCLEFSICKYKFAFLSAIPAWVDKIVSISASRSEKTESSFLLMTWRTPTMLSFWSLMGPQRMLQKIEKKRAKTC